jgi:predicted nucleic acid-binding protein
VIVLDASVAVHALLQDGASRALLVDQSLQAPASIDVEVAHVVRRLTLTGAIPETDGQASLHRWVHLGITRWALPPLLARAWELRHSVTAYDAVYVALAELLDCDLVSADARLAQAHGLRCVVRVVRD